MKSNKPLIIACDGERLLRCIDCQEMLPESSFSPERNRARGRRSECRSCRSKRRMPYASITREMFEDRFWPRINKDGPVIYEHLGSCWIWTAGCTSKGYGSLSVGSKNIECNRLSFFLKNNSWPKNALHKCDNPPCVNPDHLYDGTQADNTRDKVARGRMGIPFRRASGPISADVIQEAVFRYADGERQASISRSLNIHKSTLNMILKGKIYIREVRAIFCV